jgi:hypothetical protein
MKAFSNAQARRKIGGTPESARQFAVQTLRFSAFFEPLR